MSKFKNMKIAITHEQPLDDVVSELERLGYGCCVVGSSSSPLSAMSVLSLAAWLAISRRSFLVCFIASASDWLIMAVSWLRISACSSAVSAFFWVSTTMRRSLPC